MRAEDLRSLRWDDVQLFLALVKAPVLSKAGLQLGLDASTVSRRLSALEHRLGVALFDRGSGGLRLTPVGARLVASAREMEQSLHDFSREAQSFENAIDGRVSLTAPPGIAEKLVLPAIPRLFALHPRLRIDFDLSASFLDLKRREADIAVRTVRASGGDLVCKRVYKTRFWPLGQRKYIESIGTLVDPADARWVGYCGTFEKLPAGQLLAAIAPRVEPVFRATSLTTQIIAAEHGVGLVLTAVHFSHTYDVVPASVSPALGQALAKLPPVEIYLVCHRATRSVPRLDATWSFLEQHFTDLQAVAAQRDRLLPMPR